MPGKQVVRVPVEAHQNDVQTYIPLGILDGARPGPTLAVFAGIHATEFASQDGVARFWESLQPEEISGRVLAVLGADVRAMLAHHMWTNPVDGKRLGWGFPGRPDGTLTGVLSHTLWHEVVLQADALVDCHGGEYSEEMYPYVIAHVVGDESLDRKNVDLAMALGIPFVEVTHPGDVLGSRGLMEIEALRAGRLAVALEVGGHGSRDPREVALVYNALHNALKHLGMRLGKPALSTGEPIRLDRGELIYITKSGLLEPRVVVGQWIEKGDLFATVRDFDGTLLEEVRAPDAGVVLTVLNARCAGASGDIGYLRGFIGKIGVVHSSG
jgi:predicted deacylase